MSQQPEPDGRRLVRDRVTLTLYGALGLVGFVLNGLGSVLEPLQRQLGVTRGAVAFYPSLFAAALLIVGAVGGPLAARTGRRLGLVAAVVGMAAGALLLGTPDRWLTLVGAAVLGMGAALGIQLVPAGLASRHPARAPAALGEANAVASLVSLIAPAGVAAAITAGLGWRTGYVGPVLAVAAGLLVALLVGRGFDSEAAGDDAPVEGLEPGPLLGRWFAVLLSVSVEFCLVFWAASAFIDWHSAASATAAVLGGAFLLGMALVRAVALPLTRDRRPVVVVLVVTGVTLVGFALFWGWPGRWGSALGLLVCGLGVGLLYPVTLARLVAAWPEARDRAAARGALASGLAIGAAPLVLARLSDAVGLRVAYLVVPALLVLLGLLALRDLGRRRSDQRRRKVGA